MAAEPAAPKPVSREIRMVDGMRFDPPRFEAPPGAQVTVRLINEDSTHQVHNFLLTAPGQRAAVVQAALEMGDEGPTRAFVPNSGAVLAHSGLIQPEESEKITFQVPAQKGVYPYVCTFPGHGFVMYGALYAGEKMPPLAKDPNLPPAATLAAVAGGGKRPFVQRMFMPDAGPAAIAVALPGGLNYCWDAGACRLRYVWSGDFLDASKYWASNGNHRADPLGPTVWRGDPARALFAGGATPEFLGYRIRDGLPTFHYRLGSVEIQERIEPGAADTLKLTWEAAGGPATLLGPAGALTANGPPPAAGLTLAPASPVTLQLPARGVP